MVRNKRLKFNLQEKDLTLLSGQNPGVGSHRLCEYPDRKGHFGAFALAQAAAAFEIFPLCNQK